MIPRGTKNARAERDGYKQCAQCGRLTLLTGFRKNKKGIMDNLCIDCRISWRHQRYIEFLASGGLERRAAIPDTLCDCCGTHLDQRTRATPVGLLCTDCRANRVAQIIASRSAGRPVSLPFPPVTAPAAHVAGDLLSEEQSASI